MTAASSIPIPTKPSMASSILIKIRRGEEVLPSDAENLRLESHHALFLNEKENANQNYANEEGEDRAMAYLNRKYLSSGWSSGDDGGMAIVRYLGMVQDMLDPEYYLKTIRGVNTKYRDYCYPANQNGEQDEDVDVAHNLAERQPLLIVPLPSASSWVDDFIHGFTKLRNEEKQTSRPGHSDSRGTKRSQPEHESGAAQSRKAAPSQILDACDEDPNAPSNSTPEWWPAGCMGSDSTQCPVLAKVYYDDDQSQSKHHRLHLNDIVELVGVLSFDPMEAEFSCQPPSQTASEEKPFHDDNYDPTPLIPPPSQLPRLHVLYYNHIDLDYFTHQITKSYFSPSPLPLHDDRTFCINAFAQHLLHNNVTAAEALLLALLSTPERSIPQSKTPKLCDRTRFPPIKMPSQSSLGCASINFILPNSPTNHLPHNFEQLLCQILPITTSIQMSTSDLNSEKAFPPVKREDLDGENRLTPSILQLPSGSTLVLDEHQFQEGELNDSGTNTFRAISSIIEKQSLPYRFGFCEYENEANYSVIVLSHDDKKSVLPCTLRMKLNDHERQLDPFPNEVAKRIRTYLARSRKPFNLSVSKEVCDMAQEEFVQRRVQRRRNRETFLKKGEVKEEDFHRWLTLARLQARSRYGASSERGDDLSISVGLEDWNLALLLDDAMMASLQ